LPLQSRRFTSLAEAGVGEEPQKTLAARVPVRALPRVSHFARKGQGAISLRGLAVSAD
jgi:hypothetical protein